MSEERVLYFDGLVVRLVYTKDGRAAILHFVSDGVDFLSISSQSSPMAPEKIYELIRECEVEQ